MKRLRQADAFWWLAVLWLWLTPMIGNAVPSGETSSIRWQGKESVAFTQAKAEKRFVLLYLEAVWCHWCHVMDQRTYKDDDVAALIAEHYVPLRIDQDARPDLANRYRDYGWPATIVFDADGREIVKRQGFIAPEAMRRLLQAIVDDPSPEAVAAVVDASGSVTSGLAVGVRQRLLDRHTSTYDLERGGLKTSQKYLERDSVEYALARAAAGDLVEKARALQTLNAAIALLDPAWGGFYQYSTGGDWQHPHFEKLTTLQAEYLRMYALAYAHTGEQRFLDVALAAKRYSEQFLADESGAFYVSQDADLRPGEHSAEYFALTDTERRKLGIPRVDRNLYTQQTASMAEAYGVLHEVTGDESPPFAAVRAAEWILAERALAGGGFRHGEVDNGGPFLADTLAAGRAFLQLYRVTSKRTWLTHAGAAADFIADKFQLPAGFAGGVVGTGPIAPVARIEENISVARFANLLARYNGEPRHAAMARHARDWLAQPATALSRLTEAGILLVDDEIEAEPLHITVIGSKSDPAASTLFAAGLRLPAAYKRLDWWDLSEGPLPNADVRYPPVKRAAAFVCTNQRCSLPIYAASEIPEFLALSAEPDSSQ
ncbi:MAG: DUF255 domain-containing protein [Pseudomarimonas sp.]